MQIDRAVFFDRDGVVNDVIDRGHGFLVAGKEVRWTAPFSYAEFKLRPYVREILSELRDIGFLRILVTNQPDIAYGYLPIAEHERIMAEVVGLGFDAVFVCAHGRNDGCSCKKPKPGMLLEAQEQFQLNLWASWMIGDTENDAVAARLAGCGSTMIIDAPYNHRVGCRARVADLIEASAEFRELYSKRPQ